MTEDIWDWKYSCDLDPWRIYRKLRGKFNSIHENCLWYNLLIIDVGCSIIYDVEATPFGDQEDKSLFYTGKQWDEDAQLYYFNARWYDPETGRFITEDPVRDGLLWYGYCNNIKDHMGLDPHGMTTEEGDERGWAEPSEGQGSGEALYHDGRTGESLQFNVNTINEFYNFTDELLSMESETEEDKQNIITKVNEIISILDGVSFEGLIDNTSLIAGLLNKSTPLLRFLGVFGRNIDSIVYKSGRISELTGVLSTILDGAQAIDSFKNEEYLNAGKSTVDTIKDYLSIANPYIGLAYTYLDLTYGTAIEKTAEAAANMEMVARRDPIGFMSHLSDLAGNPLYY